MADRVIQRNDTAANWQSVNPVLATGEIGIVIDGAKGYKIGDGVTPWNDLPYPANPTNVVQELGNNENAVISQKGVTDKLSELGQEISNRELFSGKGNLSQDGTLGVASGFIYTELIPIEGLTEIKVGGYSGGNQYTSYSLCCFYDESKRFISAAGNDSENGGYKEAVISVPIGAKFFRCGSRNTEPYYSKTYLKYNFIGETLKTNENLKEGIIEVSLNGQTNMFSAASNFGVDEKTATCIRNSIKDIVLYDSVWKEKCTLRVCGVSGDNFLVYITDATLVGDDEVQNIDNAIATHKNANYDNSWNGVIKYPLYARPGGEIEVGYMVIDFGLYNKYKSAYVGTLRQVNFKNGGFKPSRFNVEDKVYDLDKTLVPYTRRTREIADKSNDILNLLDWGVSLDANQGSYIHFDNVVLSKDGDYIEADLKNITAEQGLYGGYAFIGSYGIGSSNVAILASQRQFSVRADDGTWILNQGVGVGYGANYKFKIEYINSQILIYINDNLIKIHDGQPTLTLNRIGDGGMVAQWGYWGGTIASFNVMSDSVFYKDIESLPNIETYEIQYSRNNLFLSDEQAKLLSEAGSAVVSSMLIEKSADCLTIYKRLSGNKYIAYPLKKRYKAYTENVYPAFYDNWGIDVPYIASFNGITMTKETALFRSGEAEMAVRVPRGDGEGNNEYVGGSAHGFENIVNESSREILFLIDNQRYEEDSVIGLMPVNLVEVQQHTKLFQAYTNENYWADVFKKWNISNSGDLSITTRIVPIKEMYIQNAQLGMVCVFRHWGGSSSNDYLTKRAIKSNTPYIEYNIEDGWESNSGNGRLKTPDKECKKITEYGDKGLGFSLEITNDTVKDKGGMFVGTNSSTYNKIYFDLTGSYTASQGEVLEATQTWSINGNPN